MSTGPNVPPEERKPQSAMDAAMAKAEGAADVKQQEIVKDAVAPQDSAAPNITPPSAETIAAAKALLANVSDANPEDSEANESWKVASLLDVPDWLRKLFPNDVLRWASKHRIDTKLLEGWTTIIVDGTNVAAEFAPTMIDGSRTDSTVTVREMILMKLPKHRAAARKKHFDSLTQNLEAATAEAGKADVQAEGSNMSGALGDGVMKRETELKL